MKRAELTGLVLARQDYRERDAIVTLATPNGRARLFARGVQKGTSKNRRLTNPFSKVTVDVDGEMLIHGVLDEYFFRIQEDLRMQAACLAVNEVLANSEITPEIYDRLLALWKACQQGSDDWIGHAALVTASVLRQHGIAPGVDGCMECGAKSPIVCADVRHGGFLCERHAYGKARWTKESLFRLRHVIKVPYGSEHLIDLSGWTLAELVWLIDWYGWYTQSHLTGLRFLKQVDDLY